MSLMVTEGYVCLTHGHRGVCLSHWLQRGMSVSLMVVEGYVCVTDGHRGVCLSH